MQNTGHSEQQGQRVRHFGLSMPTYAGMLILAEASLPKQVGLAGATQVTCCGFGGQYFTGHTTLTDQSVLKSPDSCVIAWTGQSVRRLRENHGEQPRTTR